MFEIGMESRWSVEAMMKILTAVHIPCWKRRLVFVILV